MRSLASVLLQGWKWINILSLDVVAGALAGGIMAAKLLDTSPGWAYWIVLPMAVWLIYTADHIIDGYKAGKNAKHIRHIFHRNNISILSLLIVIFTVLSAYVAFSFLSNEIIRFGIILGSMTIAYLMLVLFIGKKPARWLPKELLVATYYTAGIWIPILLLNDTVKSEVLIVVFICFLLAFEDLLLLSFMEAESDRQQGSISLALVLGNKRTRLLLNSLSIIISISSALIILSAESTMLIVAGLVLLLMQFALSLIYHNSHRLRQHDWYRYLSEAVFFLPALMAI